MSELPWQKQERVYRVLGINGEHIEGLKYGEKKGIYNPIWDEGHDEILILYLNDVLNIGKIGSLKDRSLATVKNQLDNITRRSRELFSSICKRAG